MEEQAALLGNVATTHDSIPAASQEVELIAENVKPEDSKPKAKPLPTTKKENIGDHYNGDDRGSYKWSQSICDVDLAVLVTSQLQKAKQLKVKIEPLHLKIEHCSDDAWQILIDQSFPHKVAVDECIWSLVPGEHIQVNPIHVDGSIICKVSVKMSHRSA